jgi:hypothetical protein
MVNNNDIYLLLMNELNNLPINTTDAYYAFINSQPTYNIPLIVYDIVYNLNTLFIDDDNTFINENLPQQVICDEELNKLIYKKIKYTKSDLLKIKNSICPITQLEFVEQQEIIELDCNHCFDAAAIIYWLTQEKAECPVCRLKYKSG